MIDPFLTNFQMLSTDSANDPFQLKNLESLGLSGVKKSTILPPLETGGLHHASFAADVSSPLSQLSLCSPQVSRRKTKRNRKTREGPTAGATCNETRSREEDVEGIEADEKDRPYLASVLAPRHNSTERDGIVGSIRERNAHMEDKILKPKIFVKGDGEIYEDDSRYYSSGQSLRFHVKKHLIHNAVSNQSEGGLSRSSKNPFVSDDDAIESMRASSDVPDSCDSRENSSTLLAQSSAFTVSQGNLELIKGGEKEPETGVDMAHTRVQESSLERNGKGFNFSPLTSRLKPTAITSLRNFFTFGSMAQVSPTPLPPKSTKDEGPQRTGGLSPNSWKNKLSQPSWKTNQGKCTLIARSPVNKEIVTGVGSTPGSDQDRWRSTSSMSCQIGTDHTESSTISVTQNCREDVPTLPDILEGEGKYESKCLKTNIVPKRPRWWTSNTSEKVRKAKSGDQRDQANRNNREILKNGISNIERLLTRPGQVAHVSAKRSIKTGSTGVPTSTSPTQLNSQQTITAQETNDTLSGLSAKTRSMWPDSLDNEADPKEWALDGSDEDVLGATKRKGSVLVRVVTWNLQAQPTPQADELRSVLLPPGKFHFFVIGTEECENSIAKSVIIQTKANWENVLRETLGLSYEMLCGHSLQATHNIVFVHRGILPLLGRVRSAAVATGLGLSLGTLSTTLGNKGGIGIAFDLGSTACIFVNCHLAAHQDNTRERNDHFRQIQDGLAKSLCPLNTIPRLPLSVSGTTTPKPDLGPRPGIDSGCELDAGEPQSPVNLADSPLTPVTQQSHSESRHTANTVRASVHSTSDQRSGSIGSADSHLHTHKSAPPSPDSLPIPTDCPPLHESTRRLGVGLSDDDQTKQRDSSMIYSSDVGPKNIGGVQGSHDAVGCAAAAATSTALREANEEGNTTTAQSLPSIFNYVVWAGDLNYRVNMSRELADALLEKDMHGELVANEQLLQAVDAGEVFSGYHEGPLNFRPTYKFDRGTDVYDTSSKHRVPAWTDRVLFGGKGLAAGGKQLVTKEGYEEDKGGGNGERRSEGNEQVAGLELQAYRSVMELRTSDHRPVIASFLMKFQERGGDWSEGCGLAVTNQTVSQVCSVM